MLLPGMALARHREARRADYRRLLKFLLLGLLIRRRSRFARYTHAFTGWRCVRSMDSHDRPARDGRWKSAIARKFSRILSPFPIGDCGMVKGNIISLVSREIRALRR